MSSEFIRVMEISLVVGQNRWGDERATTISGEEDRPAQGENRGLGRPAPRRAIRAVQCLRQSALPLQSHSSPQAWPVLSTELYLGREKHLPVCSQGQRARGQAATTKLPPASRVGRPVDHLGNGAVAPQVKPTAATYVARKKHQEIARIAPKTAKSQQNLNLALIENAINSQ